MTGRYTLEGVVLYRERLPLGVLIGLAVAVIVWTGLCFTLVAPRLDPWVQKTFFGWLPDGFVLMNGFANYPREIQLIALVVSLLCTSWIAPYVEELYFRGYLLPRLSRFGGWAAPLNAFLFSFYHFFTFWQLITRFLAVTPLAWLVQKKRNIYIGILAHLALNTISLLPAIIGILGG
jgi:membrane protease YdiL (CAAX protease family)